MRGLWWAETAAAQVDDDHSGTVEFEEFVRLMTRRLAGTAWDKVAQGQRLELRRTFDFFDKDHSGSIDAGELGAAMRALGIEPKRGEVEAMIAQARAARGAPEVPAVA